MYFEKIDENKLEEVFGIPDSQLPKIAKFERQPKQPVVENLEKEVREQLNKLTRLKTLEPNATIAITAGSRGISNIDKVLKFSVGYLKNIGANPFIVPAMGSHGGATSQGQIKMLRSLGITEQKMGCPIKASMETIKLGETKNQFPVLVDKIACQADGILIVNRVKPHTAFTGEIESGLIKMMAIGMGNQQGARMAHKQGFSWGLDTIIPDVGEIILNKLTIVGGLALVENFDHQTALIEGVNPEDFLDRERKLLIKAKELMPTLPTDEVDVLIIDEIGKNIAGTGMDTNVIGRYMTLGVKEPEKPSVSRIYVRDLTQASHGNATGIGLADFTHRRLINQVKLQDTFINSLNGTGPDKCRIPPFFAQDKTALKACFASTGVSTSDVKLLWIKNTLQTSPFFASKPSVTDCNEKEKGEVSQVGPWEELKFDKNGDFLKDFYFG